LEPYRVLVCLEVLQLEKPSRRDRELILNFLEALARDPYAKGDYEEPDEVGRAVQIRVMGRYALTYWADHAVREVKVMKIELADQK
jgi:hypothetical protein